MTKTEFKERLKEELESYENSAQITMDLTEMTGFSRSWIYRYWQSDNSYPKIEAAAIELLKRYKKDAAAKAEKLAEL